jgi:vitamin B12 transporter
MQTLYLPDRSSWREWLAAHHTTETEIWLVYYKTHTGEPSIPYNDSVEEDVTGADVRELRRPRHSGNVTLDLHLLEDRGRLTLVADYGGTRSDVFYPPWPQPSQLVTLPSYWLLDLTAQYDVSPAITLFARAANLLDTDYQQVYGYRTPGLHTYAGMQVNFGD